jgi:hypothetical protein
MIHKGGHSDMQKRRCTRSGAWLDTIATIKVQYPFSINKIRSMTVTGKVENLGSMGMFLITDELIPVPGFAEIAIHFNSNSCMPALLIKASGRTVRLTKEGVGIKFTSINLKKLQECIVQRINNSDLYQ